MLPIFVDLYPKWIDIFPPLLAALSGTITHLHTTFACLGLHQTMLLLQIMVHVLAGKNTGFCYKYL